MEKLEQLLQTMLAEKKLIQMVFSNPRKKSSPVRKATIRPVILKGELHYHVETHQEKKVLHCNLNPEDCLEAFLNLLREEFKQINIFCSDADYQVLASKAEKPRITKTPPSKTEQNLSHNQEKQYIIQPGTPCDFLVRLGVMTKDGQVIQKHYGKFRQINRFLEILSDVLNSLEDSSSGKPLKIIDFGCGKAYLTFALYHYLCTTLGKAVEITGLDLKEDVIDFCNGIAKDLDYTGLNFMKGDIADYDETASADMVVTLHACDTATDLALIKAVKWNASVILSVPCCQHELFDQISNDINSPVLKHGILKERFSAILTDSLRALKLEERGYQVTMIEFTSLEHTAKNIMIRAVKPAGVKEALNEPTAAQKKAAKEYGELAAFWNVKPSIGML